MNTRTFTIIKVLLDLKNAIEMLKREKNQNPALLMIYSFIDICAAVSTPLRRDDGAENRDIFESYLEEYAGPRLGSSLTPRDLWAARSSLLHCFSPFGDYTKPDKGARPIFYYSWPVTKEQMEGKLREKGYDDFIVLEVSHVSFIATWAFNELHRRLGTDDALEDRVIANASHFLFDYRTFGLEEELELAR